MMISLLAAQTAAYLFAVLGNKTAARAKSPDRLMQKQ
jgi:hypothetical protein